MPRIKIPILDDANLSAMASAGEALFNKMKEAFNQALHTHPTELCQSYYLLAGKLVLLRVVGRSLAEHTARSLAHVQTSGTGAGEPRLTIDLWDENLTGISSPDSAMSHELGETWLVSLRQKMELTRSPDARFIRCHHHGCTTWLDRNAEHIVGSRAWNSICMDEFSEPISLPLYTWYSDRGVHIIHAGLISEKGQGVLFAGPSMSGKSTLTLASYCAGFDYLGDDRVGLKLAKNGSFTGYSIYNSAQLESHNLANFPLLAPYAIPYSIPVEEGKDKDMVLIHLVRVFPERLKGVATIRAVALPRLVNSLNPRIEPASKAQALLALTPNAMLLPFYPKSDLFSNLTQLVEQVPVFWLDLTRNMREIPPLVRQIFAELPG